MRTVHCSDRCGRGCTYRGVVPAWGGWVCTCQGVYLPRGVYLPKRCIPACTEADTPLNRMTDRCLWKYYFAATSLQTIITWYASVCNKCCNYQVQNQDFAKGAPTSEAESCWCSKVELHEQRKLFATVVQNPLKGPGSFWVFNAQICILPLSKDPHFWYLVQQQKLTKIEYYIVLQSIWDSFMLLQTLKIWFFNLHEKVMLLNVLLKKVCQAK